MSAFLAAQALMMAYRASATLEFWTGFGIGRLTPQIPRDLSRKIADDLRYRDPREVLIDVAGLGTKLGLLALGFKLPVRIVGVALARRQLQELIGGETRTFLGIIPEPFLPVASAGFAAGEDVLSMVRSGLSIGEDLLALSAGGFETLTLAKDVGAFIGSATRIYTEAGDLLSQAAELPRTAEGLGRAFLGAVEVVLAPAGLQREQAEANWAITNAGTAAVLSFIGDIGAGFAAITNPFLTREPGRPTPILEPETVIPEQTRRRAVQEFLERAGIPAVQAPPRPEEAEVGPIISSSLSRGNLALPPSFTRSQIGVSDLRAIVGEIKRSR